MGRFVEIDGSSVGQGHPVYTIAEIGGNFLDFEGAKKLIDLAVEADVDAVKVQHYRAETVASRKAMFEMENTGVMSQFELFEKYQLGADLTNEVFDYCRAREITVFTTPAHRTDVDDLEKFDLPAYKIGSDDAVNIPLLKYVAQTGRPMLLSTGMCTMSEVERSVDAILEEGNEKLILFHCTTNYPTHPDSVNLLAMKRMQEWFSLPVGYSDHTLGIDTCYAAAVLGATVLEFHFTYDKEAEGPDHMLSKDAAETSSLVRKVRELPILMGDGLKRPMATEMGTRRNNRKSLVLVRDVVAGEKLTPENVDIKRPGYGVPCAHYYDVLGKTVECDLRADEILRWEHITG